MVQEVTRSFTVSTRIIDGWWSLTGFRPRQRLHLLLFGTRRSLVKPPRGIGERQDLRLAWELPVRLRFIQRLHGKEERLGNVSGLETPCGMGRRMA